MDNLTHTLIGALVGETAAARTRAADSGLPEPLRRNLLVTLAAVGSNLPDSDLLYSFLGGKINYLLHHRGHTHTVVIALLLAGLVYLGLRHWMQRRGFTPTRDDRRLLAGTIAFTALLHIAMDATNNYGVHPFWPLDNRWYYGDAVFIIEPLLWASCAPLAFTFRSLAGKAAVWLVLAAAVALSFTTGLFPIPIAAALTAIIVLMLLVGRFAEQRRALFAGVGLWLVTTATFVALSPVAASSATAVAAREFPAATMVDPIVTPMPANPLCWEVMLVQREGIHLAVRRGMLALAPGWVPADACLGRSLDMPVTAPLEPVPSASSSRLHWYGQVRSPLEELRQLHAKDCVAAAALRFIRAPWLGTVEGRQVLGDLRYDREPEQGFAEIDLDGAEGCPAWIPAWIAPRSEIMH